MDERTVYQKDLAANVARLQQLAADADEKKADFANTEAGRNESRYYAGMRDGLLRAISVIEGRG
jgi:hypothetical protein